LCHAVRLPVGSPRQSSKRKEPWCDSADAPPIISRRPFAGAVASRVVGSELSCAAAQRVALTRGEYSGRPSAGDVAGCGSISHREREVVDFMEPLYDFARDPLFSRYPPAGASAKPGFHAGYLGEQTGAQFAEFPLYLGAEGYPAISYELFKWRALLSAVADARKQFVMVSAGAGFGRWLVSTACALRQYNPMPFFFVGIEAEQTHFEWMLQHFRNNSIDPHEHRLWHAAIDAEPGMTTLLSDTDPARWYGQTTANTFHGANSGDRYRRHLVPCVSLSQALAELEIVDFLEVDIMGAEERAVPAAIHTINRKVRHIHIGIHAPHIDRVIEAVFAARDWKCACKFGCKSAGMTEFGHIEFAQGVQHWVNPRLAG
jgi:FkbM family methyltransferase